MARVDSYLYELTRGAHMSEQGKKAIRQEGNAVQVFNKNGLDVKKLRGTGSKRLKRQARQASKRGHIGGY